ncbi:MGMT family protein [Arthrobacter crusticola]|nr:MGMT family protein [Arthrobacter crusticola]
MDSTLTAPADVSGGDAPATLETMRSAADYQESVLDVARLIPPAFVLTYGDIAELLECGGPRQVGAAMSRSGSAAPWWRVIRAGGLPPRGLAGEAHPHYAAEGTPLRASGSGRGQDGDYAVDLRSARWAPSAEELGELTRIRERLRGPSETDTAPTLA